MARKRRKTIPARTLPAFQVLGSDGWPIGRDEGGIERQIASQRDRRINVSLANMEGAVIKEKCFPALMDALDLCTTHRRPLPSWLATAVWQVLDTNYRKLKLDKRDQRRTDRLMRQYVRWSDVEELLERRDELDMTRDDVFEAVANERHISKDAVKKSHQLVRLLLRNDPSKLYWCMARYRPRRFSGVKKEPKKP